MLNNRKSDLSTAMDAVDRDMGVTIRSLDEFDTDRLRENLSLERDSMRESLAILSADIDRMIAWRDDRKMALDVVETALEGLGEGRVNSALLKAVETTKAVTAAIKPKAKMALKDPHEFGEDFDSPPYAEPQPA